MDVLDKKIICLLDRNCRITISQIAKKLRTNRNVITYRINNLKKQGVIRKFITSINLGKLGYNTYKIYLKVNCNKQYLDLIKFLINQKEVIHLIKLEGEYNLSCVVVTKKIQELEMFITNIKTEFKMILKEVLVSIVVYSRIFNLEKIMLGKQEKSNEVEEYSNDEGNDKLDPTDKKILHSLSQEANLSYIELAKKTSLSLDVIKYRMKKIKSNMVSSFRLMLDVSKLGFFHYLILIKSNNMTSADENKLLTWSSTKKNVMYCTKKIGVFDFEINVAITDINDLKKFLNELHNEFSEQIDSYNAAIVSDVLKLNYIPF